MKTNLEPSPSLDQPAAPASLSYAPGYSPVLHAFAILFVIATFILIILGGTVTSKGAGLAVPDWPTTFNYNMFLFPPDMWVGNIFWEHTHRLMGTVVGLMAIIMCVWLWQTNSRNDIDPGESPHTPVRGWLKWLGVATLLLVIFQGLMGGLRVTQLSTWLAVFHGMTAQIILCFTVLIAAATSRWWLQEKRESGKAGKQEIDARVAAAATAPASAGATATPTAALHRLALIALVALFIQLALGATVRHHGAGLAIPDFPLSYGRLVPPLTQPDIENAMIAFADSPDSYATSDHSWYTPFHVAIHWAHRLFAIAVVGALAHLIAKVLRTSDEMKLKRPAIALIVMLAAQVTLGATTVWTGRHPEVATAHQTLGAILLATAALLFFRLNHLRLRDGTAQWAPHADRGRPPARVTLNASPLLPEGAGA